MIKIIRSLFLIVIFLGFMYGVARADAVWIEFVDKNGNGQINFTVIGFNLENQNYYFGVAPTDHTSYSDLLSIPARGFSSALVKWNVSQGGSLLYDVYLTPDHNTYYWTSKGEAVVRTSGSSLLINWYSGDAKVANFEFAFSLTDQFKLKPVPIPSALWLFGSGILGLGLIRKKIMSS